MHIKKGDNVIMLTGKDKGKTGRVLGVFPKENKVIVEGLNLVKKHQRPKREGEKGQIILIPRRVDISNVMLICQHCKKPSRVKIKRVDKNKIRICKRCEGEN